VGFLDRGAAGRLFLEPAFGDGGREWAYAGS
jgi:hypothetical protein